MTALVGKVDPSVGRGAKSVQKMRRRDAMTVIRLCEKILQNGRAAASRFSPLSLLYRRASSLTSFPDARR